MAESVEIPEANDQFEKRIAISIAIMAIILSLITTHGDNAKTDAILKTNEETNQWGYYQSKSIKETIVKSELAILEAANDGGKANDVIEKLKQEVQRYESEKDDIKKGAEKLNEAAKLNIEINDRSDMGALIIQIAIVLASVAILSKWKALWLIGVGMGALGSIIGATAYFL